MVVPGALYVGGNRTAGRHAVLTIALSYSNRQSKAYITPKAVRQAKGQGPVYEVSADNVIAGQSFVPLPFLFFRNQKQLPYKLYLSDAELSSLSGFFEVPAAVLDGTFFSLREGFTLEHRQVGIAPRWQELLNPEWAGAFRKWVADPAKQRLPVPSRIPWEMPPGGIVAMPAFQFVGYVDKWNKKNMPPLAGELEFRVSSTGIPQALFHYKEQGEARTAAFLLDAGKIIHMPWFDVTKTNQSIAPLAKPEFLKLFGSRPALLQYTCSREAGSKEMTLATVKGEKIRLKLTNGNKFEEGKTYFLRFVREGAVLSVACFLGPEMTAGALVGQGSATLYEGYPSTTTIFI